MRKLLLSMLVLGLLLAGCGETTIEETAAPTVAPADTTGPQAEPQPSPVPTTQVEEQPTPQDRTTVLFAINDFEQPLYEDLIAAFEEANPDLRIEVVSVNQVLELGPLGQLEYPDDAEQRLVAAADVVNIGASREVVAQGLIRDLGPFVEADPNFQPDDFYSDALEAFQWAGGTWAVPTTINYRLIFFDKDVLDAAGESYPQGGWTWDDLVTKAVALTVREGDDVMRWGFIPNNAPYRIIESQAGPLADYGSEPPAPRYDDGDVVEAVRAYTNLYLEEQVMPYREPDAQDSSSPIPEDQILIEGGQAAIWTDVDILWWIRNQQGNVGVAPFPAGPDGVERTPVSVSGLVMSAGTSQPEAAWRWMDFVSRQPLGSLTLGMRFMPARSSTAETSGFWDGLDEDFAATLRYAIDHSYVARQPVAYNAFEDALNEILQGERSAEDAMAEAQQKAEVQVQEEAAAQAGATPVPTFVVAPSDETPAAEGATSITFVPGLGSLNMEPFRALADQFSEANPDIAVEVKMADFVSGAPTLKAMAENSDCFEWYPSFQEADQRDAILSLAPFLDADPSFTTDDYFPQVLEQFDWQGQLMGLPADITPYIIEYNKDLFDAAGLDYPALDWTWDDFLALSVALTQGDGDTQQYGFVAEYYELNDLLLLTERLGAQLIDENADPPTLTFNDPATVEAMRWYAGLTTEHGVKPVLVTDLNKLLTASSAIFEREGLITDGRAGMWSSSPTAAAVFGERTGLNIGAAPPPYRADGTTPGSVLTSSGYFISSQTENRQACWQWISFLTGQPAAVQGLPARQSVATSDEYRQKVGASRADAYLATMGDSEQPSAFQLLTDEAWLGGAIYWYGQAFGQVIEGKASVEDALDAAQQMADDYRACVIAGDDFSQAAWQACVQETDPTLPTFLFASGQ